jgi:hypothetical protein
VSVRQLATSAAFREALAASRAPAIYATYAGAAATIAATQMVTPITRGWWLVAYLILVGGLSQLLLVAGVLALASRSGAWTPGRNVMKTQVLLWNAGTLFVAATDLVELQVGVVVGAGALVVALVLFARNLHAVDLAAPDLRDRWTAGYALLLILLGCSVAVGVALAG